jgi:hypothetical protein
MKQLCAFLVILTLSSTLHAQGPCKPFLLSLAVAGSEISFASSCIPGSESVLSFAVSAHGNRVSVESDSLPSANVDVKKSISKRAIEGLSRRDADIIVNQINPALQTGDLSKAQQALNELILSE